MAGYKRLDAVIESVKEEQQAANGKKLVNNCNFIFACLQLSLNVMYFHSSKCVLYSIVNSLLNGTRTDVWY